MVRLRLPWTSDARDIEVREPVRIHTATDGRDILLNKPDGWEVSQPWLWWLGPANGDGTGGPWGNPPPGAEPDWYRSLGAVTRCTSIIVDTIAGLPWWIMRGWERLGTPDWISDPQASRIDGRIVGGSLDDVRLSAVEFWANWITSALWYGDGYVIVPSRGTNGQPQPPLYQAHPLDMEIDDSSGAKRYYWQDQLMPEGAVIHLRGSGPYWDGHGRGVMTEHAEDMGLALKVRGYASGQYTSGVPAGYLKSQAPSLDQTKADDLKLNWLKNNAGRRSIAVLNAVTEFVPIAVSPLDAQLDSARQWSARDIATAFGVPAYMLGVPGDSSTYANVESRMIELRQFTLLPWMRRIESALDAELPRGTEIRVQTAGLERADTATRYNAYKIGLDAGFLTVNEVRAMEDRPPLEMTPTPAQAIAGTGPGQEGSAVL